MATQTHTTPNEANGSPLKGPAAPSAVDGAADMRCPDPSAHKTKKSTLQDHASAAALYSTNPATASTRNPLGSDGKLSSASAATSLKHAHAHDLPSFPVVGIDTKTSAGAAAHLANANFKSPEYPKAQQSSAAAGKAALLANNYKMAPLWQPQDSAAGSKAALLAHNRGPKVDLWQHEPHSYGSSAATIAFGKKGLGPQADWNSAEEGRKKALVAATGAVSETRRKRAQSTPAPPPIYPDSQNSAKNALSAATISHSASMRARPQSPATSDPNRMGSSAMEAARIQHSKVSREMYTDRPPVSLEVEEKKRQDALRASAISMAKQMYDVQQHHIDEAAGRTSRSHATSGATAAQNQQPPTTAEDNLKQEAMRYIGIQEAAQKLAAERLAKIAPDEASQFRSYYGYEKPSRNKLSIRRARNRASSNPETSDSSDDELQSRRIRSQMSQLNQNLALVDEKKREQDRKYLYAAAERKVQAQMLGMDKKVFDETGKMSPAMIEEWDAKARAKASANSEARLEHHGKVHIGHGKYMDQSEIDAIAQARMQPTLDEINEKTQKRLAEEEEQRLEMEEKKRQERIEKERAAEIKAEEKYSKAEEKKALKAKSAEEKAAARQEKEAEKEKKVEEKRLARESKRKSREGGTEPVVAESTALGTAAISTGATDAPTGGIDADEHDDLYRDPTPAGARPSTAREETSAPASPTSPTSPKSDSKGIKGLFNKFKRRSKHSNVTEADKGFIGGATLRNSEAHSHHNSVSDSPVPNHIPNSERRDSDVSSLSADSTRGRAFERPATHERKVSDLSEYEEARDTFNESLAPPPSFTADVTTRNSGSPIRDSKFHEVL
ncbi:Eisosome assembly protein [Kalmusia sp. IMI 367209]|nr:Eisosome assembly protein [Kalmusia sp. IMI 367209]